MCVCAVRSPLARPRSATVSSNAFFFSATYLRDSVVFDHRSKWLVPLVSCRVLFLHFRRLISFPTLQSSALAFNLCFNCRCSLFRKVFFRTWDYATAQSFKPVSSRLPTLLLSSSPSSSLTFTASGVAVPDAVSNDDDDDPKPFVAKQRRRDRLCAGFVGQLRSTIVRRYTRRGSVELQKVAYQTIL